MSNLITPPSNIDFSAAIAEITPFLENEIVTMPGYGTDQRDVFYILAEPTDFPITNAILATMNLSMLNLVYFENRGGIEFYQPALLKSCIMLPLEVTGTTISTYSVPLGSSRQPSFPPAYYKDDCTLIESQPLDSPLFVGTAADGFELALYVNVPSDKILKSIAIIVNEDSI